MSLVAFLNKSSISSLTTYNNNNKKTVFGQHIHDEH